MVMAKRHLLCWRSKEMLDNRPLPEQQYSDVDAFLQQRISENLTLDYKRELSPAKDRDRFELCGSRELTAHTT
jgi:hypothetical protein